MEFIRKDQYFNDFPCIYWFCCFKRNTGNFGSVIFQDFSTTINSKSTSFPVNLEPLGQTTTDTALISEIMFNPYSPDTLNYEFIELFNSSGTPEDISLYRFEY